MNTYEATESESFESLGFLRQNMGAINEWVRLCLTGYLCFGLGIRFWDGMCACERKAGICFTSSFKFKREIVFKWWQPLERRIVRRTKEHILILCHRDEISWKQQQQKRQIRKCRLRMYKFYCYFKRSEWNINQPLKETKWNHDSHQN